MHVRGARECLSFARRGWEDGRLNNATHQFAPEREDQFDLSKGSVWVPPSPLAMLRWPTPDFCRRDALAFRSVAALAARQVRFVRGLENIMPDRDPFILAANHSTWGEALFFPALVFVHRGSLIHFVADWNFRIVPGIGFLFRRAKVITVATKDSKPRCLNVFRRFYEHPVPVTERARAHLDAGRSIGIFPEGGVNRDPNRLLVGRAGMARLSLETGVPIVPAGIRFPDEAGRNRPTPEGAAMEIEIGAPMQPPAGGAPSPRGVRAWHGEVMHEIARLSGRSWGIASRRN